LGVAYAVWSGAGTAAVAAIGIAVLGEEATVLKGAGIGLIIVGVVAVNLPERARSAQISP
ncbi:MAG: SMR family transporter, partial [Mycetocola sp.]